MQFQIYFCVTFSHAGQQLKITKLPKRENFEPMRKNFVPMKYPREKKFDPRSTHENILKIDLHVFGVVLG